MPLVSVGVHIVAVAGLAVVNVEVQIVAVAGLAGVNAEVVIVVVAEPKILRIDKAEG